MSETIHGWIAYVLMNNSGTTFIFLAVLIVMSLILWRMQNKDDSFDLRDVICTYDYKLKKQVAQTAKTLLTGGFIVSSYYLIEHPSDTAFGIYIGAWVLNGGVVAFQKAYTAPKGVLK